MNSDTNTKSRGLKRKRTKGLSTSPSGEKRSGFNPALPLIEPAKDPNSDKETIRIKMRIDDAVPKYNKTNYETNSFNVIKTFGYNSAAVVEKLVFLTRTSLPRMP